MRTHLTLLALFLFAAPALAQVEKTASGLPVPRFVALKSSEINVRTGPGTRYPIQWVFRREDMPVEIIEEFDHWRKIRDVEGSSGWVHKTMLEGMRTVLIQGKEPRILRTSPEDDAPAMLKAEPMVIARVVECERDWCRVQLATRKGWIRKQYLWGVYPQEVFK